MALSDPYPLSFFSDLLPVQSVTLDIQRNDEQSGTGDGRYWTAQLAPPLWKFDVALSTTRLQLARSIDARAFALNGGLRASFLFADPCYVGPSGGDPGAAVTLAAISAQRDQLQLGGLPAGFEVDAGDRFTIAWGAGKVFFATFSEPAVADGAGLIPMAAVFPYVPLGLTAGAAVEMRDPYARVQIPPGGYAPFQARLGFFGDSAALTMVEKK